jgi:hypothetical protein
VSKVTKNNTVSNFNFNLRKRFWPRAPQNTVDPCSQIVLLDISSVFLFCSYRNWPNFGKVLSPAVERMLPRRGQKFALQTWVGQILTWTFLLFTFLPWHSSCSTYFCGTQFSFSRFSPGITQPQLSLTLQNFATHTLASAFFCLSSVFYLKL